MRIILASTSPSRLSILRSAGVEPLVMGSEVDERGAVAALENPTPSEVVAHLAVAKARSVAGKAAGEGAVVIGGDSMLLIDGELQGKPHTEEATVQRWRQQRGKVAELLTGHALIDLPTGREYVEVSTTTVHFAHASDEDIAAYAATGEPFGCAGAFTLEALGGWFIDRIEGDPSSVIGLSLPVVRRGVEHFGYRASQFWNR
ncbi:MAG TPA: septum formation inhibitor Maf [Candidatus Corynebacterium gallistercoris]|uniref:Nucleoside triphosphate pyrophosphatase n=1 Tax=Candidatus Corynebacterium gallistercoris TaxID=2838530 RepID=A0A9D1RYT3_9CORY|nr:septum formation inhibitor Maf [Candidatus Corynebacterium gallistercoris]